MVDDLVIDEGDLPLWYEFDATTAPRRTVAPGTRIEVAVPDNMNGAIRTEQDVITDLDGIPVNGIVGPIGVDGARLGDVLAFHIDRLEVSRDWGFAFLIPDFGLASGSISRAYTRIIPFEDGHARLQGTSIPFRPFLGIVGATPAGEPVTTMLPGDHGGNMDTTVVTAGSTVYLPVSVDGALFALGDPKAAMGDGESTGSGINAPLRVTGRLDLLPSAPLSRPLVETSEHWYAVASADTVEDAARLALDDLAQLIVRSQGWTVDDTLIFLGVVADLQVSQAVNPLATVRYAVPKRHLAHALVG